MAGALWPIGSITKLFTATAICRLAADGLLNLEAPGFEREITTRHLLTHTSGLDSDVTGDFGLDRGAIQRYAEACSSLRQLCPPGRYVSYCNAGFVILGRLIEVLTGQDYETAVRRLSGVEGVVLGTEELAGTPVALGHVRDSETGTWRVVPRRVDRAGVLYGSAAWARPADLLAFARLLLNGGRLVETMLTPQATSPEMPV